MIVKNLSWMISLSFVVTAMMHLQSTNILERVSQSKPACIGNNNETTCTSENQPGISHTPEAVETPRPISLSDVEHVNLLMNMRQSQSPTVRMR